jgi:hypothetical protein
VWRTVAPDGRIVVLHAERWRHISTEHPELSHRRGVILATVSSPDEWIAGRFPGEEWFYRENPGPSRWLRVVVHFSGREGFIVTGFPRRSFP